MDGAKTAERHRVLTLGDGDLSYSRSLLDKENWQDLDLHEDAHIQLIATTYDSHGVLTDKYAMAQANIDALTSAGLPSIEVDVQHDVDATDLSRFSSEEGLFDRIVFHHPHSGVEDVHRHRRLLSHFFHSALQALKRGGFIYVTLAGDQPERWEILRRAKMANLACLKQAEWNAPKGYTRKRHQSDKSFHRVLLHGEKVLQGSTLFRFGRAEEAKTDATPIPPPAPSMGKPEWEHVCDLCGGKRFATLQGKKTHMRMVHELNLKRKRADETFVCQTCNGRVFSDEEALKQHVVAKHGKDSEIRPDWLNQSVAPSNAAKSFPCDVCKDVFSTQEELDGHWTTLKPIQLEKVACPTCNKMFEDHRALRQHQNFCQSTKKSI